MNTSTPRNDAEAFALAVRLMQTAPSKEQHAQAKELVIGFAITMSDDEFDAAMKLVAK